MYLCSYARKDRIKIKNSSNIDIKIFKELYANIATKFILAS
jgi:hypothetical protein